MKRLTILFVLMSSMAMAQFSPTYDTVKFKSSRGKIYEVITYSDDSVMLNGVMLRSGSYTATTNYWQPQGAGIKPNPDSKVIIYPNIPTLPDPYPAGSVPVWWNSGNHALYKYVAGVGLPDASDTLSGCGGVYLYETSSSDAIFYVDSMAKICGCFTVKNMGVGSVLTLSSIEGLPFNTTVTTVDLKYGEWVNVCPASNKFVTAGNDVKAYSVNYYTKAEADTVFLKTQDSLIRYTVYSSGNENIEVLATARTVSVTVTGGTNIAMTIPDGVEVISAKGRFENRTSITFTVNRLSKTESAANRWMPTAQGWREDTGAQLRAMSSLMDIVDYKKFTLNGLEPTTICQIRIDF